jgi:hypothetical protein
MAAGAGPAIRFRIDLGSSGYLSVSGVHKFSDRRCEFLVMFDEAEVFGGCQDEQTRSRNAGADLLARLGFRRRIAVSSDHKRRHSDTWQNVRRIV